MVATPGKRYNLAQELYNLSKEEIIRIFSESGGEVLTDPTIVRTPIDVVLHGFEAKWVNTKGSSLGGTLILVPTDAESRHARRKAMIEYYQSHFLSKTQAAWFVDQEIRYKAEIVSDLGAIVQNPRLLSIWTSHPGAKLSTEFKTSSAWHSEFDEKLPPQQQRHSIFIARELALADAVGKMALEHLLDPQNIRPLTEDEVIDVAARSVLDGDYEFYSDGEGEYRLDIFDPEIPGFSVATFCLEVDTQPVYAPEGDPVDVVTMWRIKDVI